MLRRAALSASLLLAGCRSGAPSAPTLGSRGGDACVEAQLGEVAAESVSVAVAPDGIYWLGYNWGPLQRRGQDGAVTTLFQAEGELNSEELIVAGDHLYWDSKTQRSIYRMKLAGGAPERIIEVPDDDFPVELVVAGDVVYTRTFHGLLMWWRGGAVGQRELEIRTMANRGASLYLGGTTGIGQLDDPDGEVWDVVMGTAPVEDLLVTGDTLFWTEQGGALPVLHRRALAGGLPDVFTASEASEVDLSAASLYSAVAAPGGAYVPAGALVLFAPASGPPVASVVARAPAGLTDLALAGDALIAGTVDGRVHRLCLGERR